MDFSAPAIQFEDIDDFEFFSQLIDHNLKQLSAGSSALVLATDICNEHKAMLCPEGTRIDSQLYTKLRPVVTVNQNAEFGIKIQKSPEIATRLRHIVLEVFQNQIATASILDKVGDTLFAKFEDQYMALYEELLSDNELIYFLFGEKCLRNPGKKEFNGFRNEVLEGIDAALLVSGMQISDAKQTDPELLQDIFMTGFLTGLVRLAMPERQTEKLSQEEELDLIKEELMLHKRRFSLKPEIADTILCVWNARFGDKSYLTDTGRPAAITSDIAVIERFIHLVQGDKNHRKSSNEAIEILYDQSKFGELATPSVEKLAHWLNKQAILRMNRVVDGIEKLCTKGKDGKSLAIAYPLHKGAVPKMIICAGNHTGCPHLSQSYKQIKISKIGLRLPVGGYTKCEWLTKGLHAYYQKDLSVIKQQINGG